MSATTRGAEPTVSYGRSESNAGGAPKAQARPAGSYGTSAGGVALAERSEQAHRPGMPAAAALAGATPLARADIGRLLASISPGKGR